MIYICSILLILELSDGHCLRHAIFLEKIKLLCNLKYKDNCKISKQICTALTYIQI